MNPRLVFWETTAGCNLRCHHCRRVDAVDQPSDNDLSSVEAFQLIDQIASLGRSILVFSGGEPLYRADIFELIARARTKGLVPALATNGTLVTDSMADRIQAAGVHRVSISIDGLRDSHDGLRGIPGAFDLAIDALRLLKARDVPVQINFTMTRDNAAELPLIYNYAVRMGIDALHLFLLVPVGCGMQLKDSQMLPPPEVERWLEWFYERSLDAKIEMKATCAPQYERIRRQRHSAQLGKGCLAGSAVCFVSHQGDVFPCGYLPVSAGNVLVQTFPWIWNHSPLFQTLRNPDQLKGKCGECEFKRVCAGCRARAYGMSGDYLEEETSCDYQPMASRQ